MIFVHDYGKLLRIVSHSSLSDNARLLAAVLLTAVAGVMACGSSGAGDYDGSYLFCFILAMDFSLIY